MGLHKDEKSRKKLRMKSNFYVLLHCSDREKLLCKASEILTNFKFKLFENWEYAD